MPGSRTTQDRKRARVDAHPRFAFRCDNGVGVPIDSFAAQWLAYTHPCRRFAPGLAADGARLGADVVRYSFIAVDLHHLLLAGLPAHIAVGTLIAERPPHRTGRARLRHPAPTLDVGGEAYDLPHAVQSVGRALPARCPGRAVLFRVLLGPRPWLHELLDQSPGLVRPLHSYYGGVRTPRPRASSASARRLPDADRSPPGLARGSRSPGFRSRSLRTCQGLGPRRTGNALALTRIPVSPSAVTTASASRLILSRLNGWPMRTPADASPPASRPTTHGSGPMWFAIPSSQWTCTTYSSPASRRTSR